MLKWISHIRNKYGIDHCQSPVLIAAHIEEEEYLEGLQFLCNWVPNWLLPAFSPSVTPRFLPESLAFSSITVFKWIYSVFLCHMARKGEHLSELDPLDNPKFF